MIEFTFTPLTVLYKNILSKRYIKKWFW